MKIRENDRDGNVGWKRREGRGGRETKAKEGRGGGNENVSLFIS